MSAVVCAYTFARWGLLCAAIESLRAQTVVPHEIILCIDHNPELARWCRDRWSCDTTPPAVRVVENRYPGRLGSSRNTAVELATGDIVAFLDDDARAHHSWLQDLLASYASDPRCMAVGGAPVPHFDVPRPAWFPFEFDWVFGCAYRGVPMQRSKTRRLIGANMSARRSAIVAVGGFHSDDHDDMDLSHRIAHRYGGEAVIFDPAVRVTHHVSRDRLTWAYFWRRCFHVNKGKVLAFRDMEDAGSLIAESLFAARTIGVGVPRYLATGTRYGLLRALAAVAGITLAAAGHVAGRVKLALGRAEASRTVGLAIVDEVDLPISRAAAR
ncbi:MAG: glycosyltransferase [Solirubrobacterales bacterium]|nr:glycosyltransferase [Solirubrobacterales bacterium]